MEVMYANFVAIKITTPRVGDKRTTLLLSCYFISPYILEERGNVQIRYKVIYEQSNRLSV